VRLVDRIAYLNHDIDDAIRAGALDERALPAGPIALLGTTGSQRIDTLVHDLVEHSEEAGDIVQGARAAVEMDALRDFMFAEVYLGEAARREHAKIENVLRALWRHYLEDPDRIPDGGGIPGADAAQRVVDYVAGMTDRFAVSTFEALFVPGEFEA
jgi:dGTPase